jgi:hypothetical protein
MRYRHGLQRDGGTHRFVEEIRAPIHALAQPLSPLSYIVSFENTIYGEGATALALCA